jgi:hypothetical protein
MSQGAEDTGHDFDKNVHLQFALFGLDYGGKRAAVCSLYMEPLSL